MQTSDEDLLFQTEAGTKRAEARSLKASRPQQGNPIELSSKPLDILIQGNDVFTAESGFVARRVDLASGKTKAPYKGHSGPVTCLALYKLGQQQILITGSWDKSIRFWNISTKECVATLDKAHTDFVKALQVIPSLNLLVSGGSDKDIRIWSLSSLSSSQSPTFLASLRAHTRPIECLACQPSGGAVNLWSADSMGRICIWRLEKDGDEIRTKQLNDYRHHETAVYDLVLGANHVWTASADKTVIKAVFDPSDLTKPPQPVISLQHPYFVKCLSPLLDTFPEAELDYLITGSTDEGLRLFDLSDIRPSPAGSLVKNDVGGWKDLSQVKEKEAEKWIQLIDEHFHEVNRILPWPRLAANGLDVELWIVSSSLDGTIRRWKFEEMLHPPKPVVPEKDEKQEEESLMTAEEEAELAELMDD